MQIFFQPDIEKTLKLSEEESKHALKVLRLTVGDIVQIYDGKGNIFECNITSYKSKIAEVNLISKTEIAKLRNYKLHIAICPTKNINRFEWFLEKTTEIGIDEITPVLSERSERKIIKYDRLEKILISAIKQSKNPYLPKLNKLITLQEFVSNNINNKQQFVAHCINSQIPSLKSVLETSKDTTILIGPEGDFSEQEVKNLVKNNWKEINLGPSRLRTETAGVIACHTVNILNQ